MLRQLSRRVSLRQRIVIPVLVAVTIMAVGAVWLSHRQRMNELSQRGQERLAGRAAMVRAEIDTAGLRATALARLVAAMPAAQKAMAAGDRAALSALVLPMYQAVAKDLGLKQFQFHSPPATSFFRAHKPAKFGDDLSSFRRTVVQVNQTVKTVSGVEKGVAGAGIRGVTPVSYQGKHLGSVEFGLALNNAFAARVAKQFGFALAILAPDGKGGLIPWAASDSLAASAPASAVDKVLGGGKPLSLETEENGRGLLRYLAPLKDFSGKPVAALSLVEDVTQAQAEVWDDTWLMAGVAAALALLLLAVIYFTALAVTRVLGGLSLRLGQAAERVAQSAQGMHQASQGQAEGASQQAASLEETSASLEELAAMTRRNAEHAQSADSMMKDAGRIVQEAGTTLADLSQAMERATTASEETAGIIKTIDEIAFQTNLLALNAAVEAARAGEAGAGFAVVADEVRNLAMRAAEAAKHTAELIEGNLDNTKQSGELASAANQAFGKVRESAAGVGELVGEIASASQEQSQGIGQISTAVGEMDQVTQRVAAGAEESASAAAQLDAQAAGLRDMVGSLDQVVKGGRAASHHPQHELEDEAGFGRQETKALPWKKD